MGCSHGIAFFLTLFAAGVYAATPEVTGIGLWPDPLMEEVPIAGYGGYDDSDEDPFAGGDYRFVLNEVPGPPTALPSGLVLNADWSAMGDGLHVPSDSTELVYTDGVWNGAFSFQGNPRLGFENVPMSSPADGGVDFWFRLHHDLSDSIYASWRVFFWLTTSTGDHIYVETSVGTIYGTSYSSGQYAGAWTGTLDLHADEWHHLAYGWNAADSVAIVWLDGQIRGSSTAWPGVTGVSVEVFIGNGPWGGRAAEADMDAIRVWNRLPTNQEIAWAANAAIAPAQCAVLLDSSPIPVGTTVQFQAKVADETGAWSPWISSVVDTVREALIDSIFPPPRLAALDVATLPLLVSTSIPCQCRASEETDLFSEMPTILQTSDSLIHTMPWLIDPEDEYHEIAVRCSSLAGDIDPNLFQAQTGYRQLRAYDPVYPRVGLLWGDFNDTLGLQFYSGYSLIISWSWSGFSESIQRSLRSLNPDLKILTTGFLSYGGPPMDEWAALTDPEDPHFNWVLRDPIGAVILESYWGHPFYNLTDSSCVEWLVRYNVDHWRQTNLMFDGIYFDRIHDFIAFISDQIDADQDGVPDEPSVLDSVWSDGMEYYLQLIREELPNEVMCGNDTPLHFGDYINGRLFEMGLACVMDEGGSWLPIFEEYGEWEAVHREPYNLPVVCNQAPLDFLWRWGLEPWNSVPPDSVEWVRTRYQRMRFGLGTTLLSEGVSVYDFGTTWWGNAWWYDEYDVNLGYPLAMPYRVVDPSTSLAFDDFEDGTPGNYNLNQWGSMWAEVTDEPGEVISGTYSLKGGNDNQGQMWNEFAHSNVGMLPLQGDSTYTVTFLYRVIQPNHPNGYFYFFARSLTGGVSSDVGNHSWQGQTGDTDSITATFTLESYDDYYLVFGLKYTGEYAIDDIRVARGGGGMWRRDFESGCVVVNPAEGSQTVDLGETLYRFPGLQDPVHNNGLPVTELTLQGHDAVLLLYGQGGQPPPGSLTIATREGDAILRWSTSPGADGYHVYRDESAWFSPAESNKLTPEPIFQLTYVDEGILGDPDELWFYLVTAVSTAGPESAPSNRVGLVQFVPVVYERTPPTSTITVRYGILPSLRTVTPSTNSRR